MLLKIRNITFVVFSFPFPFVVFSFPLLFPSFLTQFFSFFAFLPNVFLESLLIELKGERGKGRKEEKRGERGEIGGRVGSREGK